MKEPYTDSAATQRQTRNAIIGAVIMIVLFAVCWALLFVSAVVGWWS